MQCVIEESPPFLTFTDMSTDLCDFSEGNRHVPSRHRPNRQHRIQSDCERDDRPTRGGVDMSRATQVSPYSGRCCAALRHSLVRAYGIPGVNAQFELLGVSGFELALWVFLGKLITCITGGVRVKRRTMGTRYAISVC